MQSFEVFGCFLRHFRPKGDALPEDLKQVVSNYSEDGIMSVQNLHDFLTEYQEQTDADAQAIFNRAKHHNLQHKGLHLLQYLYSDLNYPLQVIFL